MTALTIIIDIVLILISIVLIVAVLMQQGQRQGLGAIGGGAETFFGKNKASSMEGKLQRITKIAVAVFVILAIVATILVAHNTSSSSVSVDDLVNEYADVLQEAESEAAGEAEAVADEAAEAVEETAEEAEEAVEDAAETVEEAVEEAVEAVDEAVEDAAETTEG